VCVAIIYISDPGLPLQIGRRRQALCYFLLPVSRGANTDSCAVEVTIWMAARAEKERSGCSGIPAPAKTQPHLRDSLPNNRGCRLLPVSENSHGVTKVAEFLYQRLWRRP
jgi:hypothetical protein